MSESWTSRRESVFAAALALFVCALACAGTWGFTVDDALISVRYARNLASGAGWRFDADGPVTDGVTPLAWPILIVPFVRGDPLDALDRLRVLGLVLHLGSMAWLGARIARVEAPRWMKLAGIVLLGTSVPAAAHATSGMETALVTTLATVAATTLDRPRTSALFAGACAALRPEMIPWAIALSGIGTRRFSAAALAAAPPLAIAVIRLLVFGRAAPLAVLAKPSDLSHGAAYALAALVACATPALAVARPRGHAIGIVSAFGAHLLAIVLAGGDWMPYARLLAPLSPGLVFAAVASSPTRASFAVRSLACAAVGTWMWISAAPLGRSVARDRRDLVLRARPVLGTRRVAAIDIGWVSAATGASVVDLAGVTDPEIAALAGGHTSKHVDAAMLLDRGASAVLLYLDHTPSDLDTWPNERYPRATEARLARSELFAARFGKPVFLPSGKKGGYVVVFRLEQRSAHAAPDARPRDP